MKKIVCLLMTLLFVIGNVSISAAGNDVSVTVNGTYVIFDQPPIIQNGRTLVPMRAIFEALDFEVEWYDGVIDVYNSDGDNIMTLWIDDPEMYIDPDGSNDWDIVELDVPPQIINSRTLVPVRAISESIGADVQWNNSTRTVIIKYTSFNSIQKECEHDSTTEEIVNTEYEEIDEDYHLRIESIREYCDDCGELVDSYMRETEEAHSIRNGVCRNCGYEEEEECEHRITYDVISIDERRYEQDDSDVHTKIEKIITYCRECGEEISSREERTSEKHNFKNGICSACGYKQSSTVTESDKEVKPPISEKNITDWVDGAYKYISVPQGKAIRIPNTSSGTLKVNIEGKYNALLRNEKAVCTVKKHGTKEEKDSETISKNAEMIIENTGDSAMLVYIAAEYASYAETSERIFSAIKLSEGESAMFGVENSNSNQTMYISGNYEWIRYDDAFESIKAYDLSGNKNSVVYAKQHLIITAKNDLTIEYPSYLVEAEKTSEPAYRTIDIAKGETKRFYASDKTAVPMYTDGEHAYDLVMYNGSKNTVSKQSQNIKSKTISVSKNNYADITNQSNGTLTIKIPSKIVKVESR